MESLRIEIINPKAKRLLKNLADMELIKITPSLDEITKEVESVRKARYEK